MGVNLGRALERVQGLIWGDQVKDSSLYFDSHTLVLDVVGRDADAPAFVVRGLNAVNAPMPLLQLDKNGVLAPSGTNPVANPGYEVWQRGAGPYTAHAAFTADAWQIVLAGSSTISVSRDDANVDTSSQYCAAITYTHNASSRLAQNVEDYFQLRARTLTLAIRVKTSAAGAVRPYLWDNVNGFRFGSYHTGDGTYQTLWVSGSAAATATGVQVGLMLDASATIYADNATLTPGSAAAPYVPLHPGDDLARCQRYYWEIGGLDNNQLVGVGQCTATTAAQGVVRFPVEMMAAPTVTVSAATDFDVTAAAGTVVNCSALTASLITKKECRWVATVASGLVAGSATILRASDEANARLKFEANP